MKEPPIQVEPEGVKPELRKLGHGWFDLAVALTAIVLSVISLVVAINNARTQEKMVAAATWPLLQYGTTNMDDARRKIAMTVANTGVGPALLKSVRVTYGDRRVRNLPELLSACCGWDQALVAASEKEGLGGVPVSSRLSGIILRPGDEVSFLVVPRTETNAAAWDRLDKARFRLKFDACYCSVFQECWRSDLDTLQPRRVKRCPVVTDAYR